MWVFLLFNIFLFFEITITPMGLPSDTDLIQASHDGDFDVIVEILEANQYLRDEIDINAQDDHGRTALHWAAWFDYDNIVRLLLYYGADTSILEDDDGCNALNWALENGSVKSALVLIKHPASNLMLRDRRELLPLQIVCVELDDLYNDNDPLGIDVRERKKINYKKIIRQLVLQKALVYDVMYKLEEFKSEYALPYLDKQHRLLILKPKIKEAIFKNQYGLVAYYATKVTLTMFDEKGDNPLHWAIEADSLDIIKLILSLNPYLILLVNKYNETPVEHAIFHNRWDALLLLCKLIAFFVSDRATIS